jgi:SAM-dependent methyltransferase
VSRRATPSTRTFTDYLDAAPDRTGLYAVVAAHTGASRVLYPVSSLDVTPSYTWPDVTYVDTEQRAQIAFADPASAVRLIERHKVYDREPRVRFLGGEYDRVMSALPVASWDLLISLHAGPVGANAARCLKPGGWLLAAHPVADPEFVFDAAVLLSVRGRYRVVSEDSERPAARLFRRV